MKGLFSSNTQADARGIILGLTIGAALVGGIEICRAMSNEITGRAEYVHLGKPSTVESVTRTASPEKFHQVVGTSWKLGGACLTASTLGGLVSFFILRKLND